MARPLSLPDPHPLPIFEHFESLVTAPDYLSLMDHQIFCLERGKSERSCRREWLQDNLSYKRAEYLIRIEVAKEVLALPEAEFNMDYFIDAMGYTSPWGLHKFMRDAFEMTCLEYRFKKHGYISDTPNAKWKSQP